MLNQKEVVPPLIKMNEKKSSPEAKVLEMARY